MKVLKQSLEKCANDPFYMMKSFLKYFCNKILEKLSSFHSIFPCSGMGVIITRRVNFAAWVHSARQAGSLVEALQTSSGNQPFQLIRAPYPIPVFENQHSRIQIPIRQGGERGGPLHFASQKFVKFREKTLNVWISLGHFQLYTFIQLYIYTSVSIFVFVYKFVGKTMRFS
jgi:hypothetical protein